MKILLDLLPTVATIAGFAILLFVVDRVLERSAASVASYRFRNQLIMLALTATGVLAVLLIAPIDEGRRNTLIQLLGYLLTAAIALSSATFLGNAMAGVMLKAVRSFRTGDFIDTGEHFGRVSERGLFHTEIQTEFRNLTTLPNLYLVTHPVTTIRSSGTFITAEVSLGYDVPRQNVEKLLLEAAERAKLAEPFVRILGLGDFSVTYRVAGLLVEVRQLLTARSRLQGYVLDCLHEGGVEIVSPNFMNQRVLGERVRFVPKSKTVEVEAAAGPTPEEIAFDKAEAAQSVEELKETFSTVCDRIGELEKASQSPKEGEPTDDGQKVERELTVLRMQKERLEKRLAETTVDDG